MDLQLSLKHYGPVSGKASQVYLLQSYTKHPSELKTGVSFRMLTKILTLEGYGQYISASVDKWHPGYRKRLAFLRVSSEKSSDLIFSKLN